MYQAMKGLAGEVALGSSVDPFESDYYARWIERKKGKWSIRTIKKFVRGKYNLMLDMKENGMKDPIIIDQDNRLCDGGHRLVILDALGYESAIVRRT